MSIEIWDWGLGYIYLWDVLIAWWGGGWDTKVAYFPLEEDWNDKWKNWISITKAWTITFTTLSSWKKVANFQSWTVYTGSDFMQKYLPKSYTVSYWYTVNNSNTNRRNQFYIWWWFQTLECWATTLEKNWATKLYYYWDGSEWSTHHSWWINAVITVEEQSSAKMYINWSLYTSHSTSPSTWFLGIWYAAWSWDYHNWYMSEFIVDGKVRTTTEISNYYNQTKANYWL